ncbi:MAG: hypothetical protein K2G88_06165 [Oscillospiraceae bacterium]|nr:hypothetical protein [Oscillospiraceae bacterium]
MRKKELIAILEKGYQIGVSKIINYQKTNFVYTYAIQKIQGKYLVYIDEYDLDNFYANEMEDTEWIIIYDSFSQFMENFQNKHGIRFEDFYVSKGQKFFNSESYLNF